MTYKIIKKEKLAHRITRMEIEAPDIVSHARPGQFVVVISHPEAERIPLTIADLDPQKGSVTLVIQEIGHSTTRLTQMIAGENIYGLLGPLGKATHVSLLGTIICVGGGVGVAEMIPIARAFKNAGNRVVAIIGARSKDLIILEEELKTVSHQIHVATDDGSYGVKGLVTDVLKNVLAQEACHLVYTIGPVPMMKAVAEMTRPDKIKTIASLNPIMVDATGMCGACRCKVEGKTVFACLDGPEFDAHQVDFEEIGKRLKFFKTQEDVITKIMPANE